MSTSRTPAAVAFVASSLLHGGLGWTVVAFPDGTREMTHRSMLLADDHAEVLELELQEPAALAVEPARAQHQAACAPITAPAPIPAGTQRGLDRNSPEPVHRRSGRRRVGRSTATSTETRTPGAEIAAIETERAAEPRPDLASTEPTRVEAAPGAESSPIEAASDELIETDETVTAQAIEVGQEGGAVAPDPSSEDTVAQGPAPTIPSSVDVPFAATAAQEMGTASFAGPRIPTQHQAIAIEVDATIELQAGQALHTSGPFEYAWGIRIAGRDAGGGRFASGPDGGRGSILRFRANSQRTELAPDTTPSIEIYVYPIADWTYRHNGGPRDRARISGGTVRMTTL